MHAWVVLAHISFINSPIVICRFLFTWYAIMHGVVQNKMFANPKLCGSHEHVTSHASRDVYYVLV